MCIRDSGFDDSGAMFDGDGNLKNWWSDADKKNFEAATKPVSYTHLDVYKRQILYYSGVSEKL